MELHSNLFYQLESFKIEKSVNLFLRRFFMASFILSSKAQFKNSTTITIYV